MSMKTSPRDVFLHLLSIVTLYIGLVSLVVLLFQYINYSFPDELGRSFWRLTDVVRRSMASLIVAWPVYLGVQYLLQKEARKYPDKHDLTLKKWLSYLTLFIAALIIIVDLISLLNNFLAGELTVSFALKVVAVLFVLGSVFWYYHWDLQKWQPNSSLPRLAAIISSVIIAISIVSGFFIIGTPAEQRARRFDERRIDDLQFLQVQVIDYWRREGKLPQSLAELYQTFVDAEPPRDPVSGKEYDYKVKSDDTFELCAEFALPSREDGVESKFGNKWQHPAGYYCFSYTISVGRDKLFAPPPRPYYD